MVQNTGNLYDPMGVRGAVVGGDTKSNLDNIVGSLWQARQESSGSSVGNQSPHNGDDLSEGEGDVGSPDDEMGQKEREGSEDQDMASDLRLAARDHPFSFPHLGHLPGLPALEALNKQQKELLGNHIIQGFLQCDLHHSPRQAVSHNLTAPQILAPNKTGVLKSNSNSSMRLTTTLRGKSSWMNCLRSCRSEELQ